MNWVLVQVMIEQLMQEWKVGDFAVAESIFKSRQRQLKQKGGAQLRQKMQVYMQCWLRKYHIHVARSLGAGNDVPAMHRVQTHSLWLQNPEVRLARLKAQLGGQEPLNKAPAPAPRHTRPPVLMRHANLAAPEPR